MDTARSTELDRIVRTLHERIGEAAKRHDYENLRHIAKRLDLGENVNAIPTDFEHTEFTMLVGVTESPQGIWNLLTSMARVNTTSDYAWDQERAEALERLFFELYNEQLERRGRILPREETIVVVPQRAFGWRDHDQKTYDEIVRAGAACGLIPCDADVVAFSSLNTGWEILDVPRIPFFVTHVSDRTLYIRKDGRRLGFSETETRFETRATTWIFQKAK